MYKHDVYISFSGTDYTLDDFVHQLSNALRRKRIRAFADPKRLKSSSSSSGSEEFGAIPDARKIEKSKIAIVVLSRKYASTAWCLDELLQILRCRRERGQVVIPVFDGEFPVLAEERLGSCGAEFLEEARAALEAIADLAGWNSRYW